MCLWLRVSSPGQVRAGSGKPSGSNRTLAFPERRRRCSGLPGEGRGGRGHPWASHCVLCAGRGARHMLQLQRTLDTHSIPGRVRPCLQSSPRIFANPLLLPCRPRAVVWPPSSLCKQHFNYKGGSSRYLLQRCPLSGQQQLRGNGHPSFQKHRGAVSRKQGPRLLSLSDVTSLLHRYLLSLPHMGGDIGGG